MKQLLVILTLLMFFKPILPVLEYAVNYDYIVNELCENKLKPELKCNGKCHLTKELAKASEGNLKNSSDKKINFEQTEIVFFQEIKPIDIRQIYFLNKTSIGNNYSNLYFHLNDCAFFHPPTFIS